MASTVFKMFVSIISPINAMVKNLLYVFKKGLVGPGLRNELVNLFSVIAMDLKIEGYPYSHNFIFTLKSFILIKV